MRTQIKVETIIWRIQKIFISKPVEKSLKFSLLRFIASSRVRRGYALDCLKNSSHFHCLPDSFSCRHNQNFVSLARRETNEKPPDTKTISLSLFLRSELRTLVNAQSYRSRSIPPSPTRNSTTIDTNTDAKRSMKRYCLLFHTIEEKQKKCSESCMQMMRRRKKNLFSLRCPTIAGFTRVCDLFFDVRSRKKSSTAHLARVN